MSAFVGGLLIGVAASILWLFSGRVAGVSGILGSAIAPGSSGRGWRFAFLIGLPLGALLALGVSEPLLIIQSTPTVLIMSGLLVGVGTQIGSGCTSGHGVCGLARLSTRSLVATITFMVTAALVVWGRNVLG